MKELVTADEMRQSSRAERCAGHRIGLVPTLGFLHEGHLSLIRAARAENDVVVLSVFVNPTQFGPGEDFDAYPRDLDRDRMLARDNGVDALFVPTVEEMYPDGASRQLWLDPGKLANSLCGASRPGHFRGVATVVAKLLNIVQADSAYFGQKDGQQAVIVSRMARELAFPSEIRVLPTIREPDGLALSSRNAFLRPGEREQAPTLHRVLLEACRNIEAGERNVQTLERGMRTGIERAAPLARIDDVTIADLLWLQPIIGALGSDAILAIAAFFGSTRLIDNVQVRFRDGKPEFS
ncbi:MAG: pantoate--beta-alanine ligase [Chloroflexota bacterium]